jgi:hypothetical protein
VNAQQDQDPAQNLLEKKGFPHHESVEKNCPDWDEIEIDH